MHDHEPCGVDGCPALACSTTGFCAVHEGAKIASNILVTVKCTACRQPIKNGDWISRDSVMGARRHAHCPPPKPPHVTKRDMWKPLIDEPPRSSTSRLVALALLAVLSYACGASSPTAPTSRVALAIRVLTRGAELPINGAAVRLNGSSVGTTAPNGIVSVDVEPGAALRVDVSAGGFDGFGADGSIANAETWTFYLASTTGSAQ